MLTRTQKDIIRDLYIEERETGYCSFDFDDHHHDLRLMGELLELALFWDEENEEWYFASKTDEETAEEGLEYYREIRGL